MSFILIGGVMGEGGMTGEVGRAILCVRDIVSILLGALLSAFALRGFLVPNRFFDGGITGSSLVLHENTTLRMIGGVQQCAVPTSAYGHMQALHAHRAAGHGKEAGAHRGTRRIPRLASRAGRCTLQERPC